MTLHSRIFLYQYIQALRKKKASIKVVDVDKSGDKCDWVKHVPLIKLNGKEVNDLSELAEVLK